MREGCWLLSPSPPLHAGDGAREGAWRSGSNGREGAVGTSGRDGSDGSGGGIIQGR